ncbi:serine/threonine-protein phosphatase 6 regulatory ankyrin repeat subunit B-like isoform X2 [Haliotis rubra]|uniref:serine/threonine-protein phosphatase 6 regulatory ankyrin repeat subunit B-like isoform X2 n=1 Tax=Haliotis rubra TaxID=36100 RepID=UPI001EE4EB7E|nr:serine/threonine-protein phosphatase 6 regulatory ankyrin repeat subunit B-like isoform X2 [Haliotis rubra]
MDFLLFQVKNTFQWNKGRTPLLEASCRSIESVKLLLNHGADVNAEDIDGYTILHSKFVYTDSECLEMILSKVSPRLGATSSPLRIASEYGNLDCLLLLLEWYSGLTLGEDALNPNDGGSTALMEAILSGIDKRDKVEALINAGADIHLTNKNGNSALHLAAHGNSVEIVEKLIGLGADVNQQNGKGNTPLHLALSAESTCVETLLKKGADILLENSAGVTPLLEAGVLASVETLKLLLEYCPNNPLSTHDLKLNPLLASPNLDKVKLLTGSGFCPTPVTAQKLLIDFAMDNFRKRSLFVKDTVSDEIIYLLFSGSMPRVSGKMSGMTDWFFIYVNVVQMSTCWRLINNPIRIQLMTDHHQTHQTIQIHLRLLDSHHSNTQ